MRSTKSPSKYTSLAKLQEIAANWYRGVDGQDYEASEVDALIIAKADKISDEMMADHYDFCDDYEAAQDAEYQHEISDSLLVCAVASCNDGTLPAGAFADWSALVAEAAVSHFFTCGMLVVHVHCSLSMNHKRISEMKHQSLLKTFAKYDIVVHIAKGGQSCESMRANGVKDESDILESERLSSKYTAIYNNRVVSWFLQGNDATCVICTRLNDGRDILTGYFPGTSARSVKAALAHLIS